MPSAGALVHRIGIAATAMSVLSSPLGAAEAPIETPDARRDMIIALQATGPHPSLGGEARTFDRLIGTWHCEYAVHGEEVRWILDGRAVQDIWIAYPADSIAGPLSRGALAAPQY